MMVNKTYLIRTRIRTSFPTRIEFLIDSKTHIVLMNYIDSEFGTQHKKMLIIYRPIELLRLNTEYLIK